MSEKATATANPEKTSHRSYEGNNPRPSSHAALENPFFGLQQTLGNQAMLQLLEAGVIQAKLRLSQPGDGDEQEADRAAEKVVSATHAPKIQRKCACAGGTPCAKCASEDDETIHRSAADSLLPTSGLSIQRAPVEKSATPDEPPAKTAPHQHAAHPLVVEDDAEKVEPHQMRKSQFLALLRTDACATADAVLMSVGKSTNGCPYIEKWLAHYEKQSSQHMAVAMRKYAPETARARSAHEAIRLLLVRIQKAALSWAKTGKIEGLPAEMADEITGQKSLLEKVHDFATTGVAGAIFGFIGGKGNSEDSGSSAVMRKARAAEPGSVHDAGSVRSQLGSGHSLDYRVQSQMSSAFGYDFSGVRVHTDSSAAKLSSDLQARAFTIGNDVAFASNEYRPGTLIGDALIAHELAHVVQQSGTPIHAPQQTSDYDDSSAEQDATRSATEAILGVRGGESSGVRVPARRALSSGLRLQRCSRSTTAGPGMFEFAIRGKFQDSASFPNLIFFENEAASLDPAEKAKIGALALPAGDMLTLNGFTSEEAPPATKLSTINARLDAVAAELVAKGHDPAKITKTPQPLSSEGRIDYRRLRSVEVVRPGVASAVPSAAAPPTAACAGPDETHFVEAETEAEAMIAKAVTALGPPVDPAMAPLVTRFFPGATPGDVATIRSNLGAIKTQLHRLLPAANHQCAIIKYAACEAGTEAENSGSGGTAMMTMCPTFFDPGNSKKDRGGTLIHEAAHGTPGLVTDDKAYAHERLIEFLSLADAVKNSDSYVLLTRLFDVPGSLHVGPAAPDILTGMSPPEEAAARRTIAWLEKWLIWSYQEMSSLYDTINDSIPAGAWTNTYYEATMGLVAPIFGLTPPPTLPSKADKFKVASIHDRFHTMRFAEKGTSITLHKGGADTWAPGPGTSVNLSSAFFADSPRGQLDRLLAAIAKATPDISAPFVAKYVALADKIRLHMGGGAPT